MRALAMIASGNEWHPRETLDSRLMIFMIPVEGLGVAVVDLQYDAGL